MEKHEVDPATQASMLPATPEQVAVEGAYYAAEPTAGPEPEAKLQPQTPDPEQEKQEKIASLEAEGIALDFLGRAQATNKKISEMTRGQTRLRLDGKNHEEQARLGQAIETSGKNRFRFRRVAKKHFGLSIGIETEEVTKTIEAKGVEEQVIKVVATEPERQAELVDSYKLFLKSYEDKPARRKTRRAEIVEEIAALKAEADINPATGDTTPSKLGRVAVNEASDTPEEAPRPLTDVVYMDGKAVQLETLVSPEFDPDQALTMTDYLREIASRMTIAPREDSTEDSALQVFGKDFARADPAHLLTGLIFPWTGTWVRPEIPIVEVREWYCDLDKSIYSGMVPFSTRLATSQELYDAIVGNSPWFTNRMANRVEKANEDLTIEKREDLGGEAALYGLTDRHLLLEGANEQLLAERKPLIAVSKSLDPDLPLSPRRVKNLEIYRLAGVTSVQTMVSIACKGLKYGTNEAQDTWNAVFSQIHRSTEAATNFKAYIDMAIDYNDAVRGKINQAIHGIGGEIARKAINAINNIDREYKDKERASRPADTSI